MAGWNQNVRLMYFYLTGVTHCFDTEIYGWVTATQWEWLAGGFFFSVTSKDIASMKRITYISFLPIGFLLCKIPQLMLSEITTAINAPMWRNFPFYLSADCSKHWQLFCVVCECVWVSKVGRDTWSQVWCRVGCICVQWSHNGQSGLAVRAVLLSPNYG